MFSPQVYTSTLQVDCMKKTMKRSSRKSGFTLIEILLVVVIIGILVGIAVPRLSGRVEQSQIAAARSTMDALGTALDLYEMDTGRYPASLDALVNEPSGVQNWCGPYLKKGLPGDPWGNPYAYKYPGTHNPHGYDLSSAGPQGGEPIQNWTP